MRCRPYPFITVDNSYGPFRGRVYLVYASNNPSGNGNKSDIFIRHSDDQCSTWTAPRVVNDDPNSQNNFQFHPAIWCEKSSGRLYVKFYDTRRVPTSDSMDVYATYSDDGGITFAPNQRLTNRTFKINFRNLTGANYQGDYERIPTLRETLALCKGRVKVIIELKSYGHDQKLEERVAQLVEEAGMVDDSVFMSLDPKMAARMKKLRPEWRVGILVAKAVGDVTTLEADFVAVEARMATARFVRRNRRAGRDVYVCTVNDPAWMLTTMSRGVDGLITDVPEVARKVIDRRNAMSDTQRFLVALLIRLGAHTDALAKEDALRP